MGYHLTLSCNQSGTIHHRFTIQFRIDGKLVTSFPEQITSEFTQYNDGFERVEIILAGLCAVHDRVVFRRRVGVVVSIGIDEMMPCPTRYCCSAPLPLPPFSHRTLLRTISIYLYEQDIMPTHPMPSRMLSSASSPSFLSWSILSSVARRNMCLRLVTACTS